MASKDTHNSFNMFIFAEKKHNICHIVYVKGKEKQNSIMKKVWYFSGQQKSFNNSMSKILYTSSSISNWIQL